MAHHYDPNQPRIPAKHDGGGRWTNGVPAPLSELDPILNPRGEGGRAGTVQFAFLDSKPPIGTRLPGWLGILGLAAEIFSHLSKDNSDKQRTILSFQTYKFRRNGDGDFEFRGVQTLTDDEIKKKCGELEKVQQFTNEEFDKAKGEGLLPAPLGTKVHAGVKARIDTDDKLKKLGVEAEISFAGEGSEKKHYGAKGTTRLDVYNPVDDETICIADIKTGKSELSAKRMQELLASVTRKDENKKIKEVIITQVRPDIP